MLIKPLLGHFRAIMNHHTWPVQLYFKSMSLHSLAEIQEPWVQLTNRVRNLKDNTSLFSSPKAQPDKKATRNNSSTLTASPWRRHSHWRIIYYTRTKNNARPNQNEFLQAPLRFCYFPQKSPLLYKSLWIVKRLKKNKLEGSVSSCYFQL